jgi:SAM-dependent methyltransferase
VGRTVVGIEREPAFAQVAANSLDEVICADLEKFDWESALNGRTFDCIIFADVLEHLVDPFRHLASARDHLCSGGVVVISLPNVRHLSVLFSVFLRGTFPRRDRGIFDDSHLRWFTLSDACECLNSVGLDAESRGYNLRWGDRGGGRVNRLLNRLPHWLASCFPLREFLTYQFCIRARLRER